jgi:hypothetical protein
MGRRLYVSANAIPPGSAPVPGPWRAVGVLAWIVALAALCLVAAQSFWRIAAPPATLPMAAVAPEDASALLIASAPFGRTVAAAKAPAVAASMALPGDARLLGVFAGRGGSGQALFRLPDRGPVLVSTGGEVVPGVELVAVLPDRVRVRERGETREILLRPAVERALVARTAPSTATASGSDRSACAAPPGFKGNVYRINAELLSGMATQPASWKPLLAASAAGLQISEGGGFAAMLGLQPGDVLREANGIRLSAADDLVVAVVKPLQGNQAVRVKGARGGSELELLLVNASACGGAVPSRAEPSPEPAAEAPRSATSRGARMGSR